MKAVILAGGRGTRISEESTLRPKPMIEIGGKPILWHIMKIYSAAGINDFIVCLGYKGYFIKEYFANYYLQTSDVTIDIQKNEIDVHAKYAEPWRVTLVDTGAETMTGGRIKRVAQYIGDDDFCVTYGDGVSDLAVRDVLNFHRSHGRLASVTAVQPRGRFGSLSVKGKEGIVAGFEEKPAGDGQWVNAGFFVLSPKVIEYIDDDASIWERDPMERLAQDNELRAFQHTGFWHAMDTMRDKTHLEELWETGRAPWQIWS